MEHGFVPPRRVVMSVRTNIRELELHKYTNVNIKAKTE